MSSKKSLSCEIREVTELEMRSFQSQHFTAIFANRLDSAGDYKTPIESAEKITKRRSEDNRYRLRLGVFVDGKMAGWHTGYAVDAETYYMQNSAVLPEFRNQGLYSRLLEGIIEKLASEGFQVVTSTHHPNNAAILIPKLKRGFIISGVQLHERFKFLIEMKYIYNKDRRHAYTRNIGLED